MSTAPIGSSTSIPVRSALAAAVLAGAAGVGMTVAPLPVVIGVGVLVAASVVSRLAAMVFAASLLALAYAPTSLLPAAGFLTHPELQKGAVYLALIPLLVSRGASARLILVLPAYVVSAVLTLIGDRVIDGLTLTQAVSSFVTLTAGWLAIAIRWQWDRDAKILKVLAVLPVVCVGLGVILQVLGLHELVQSPTTNDPVTRLRGAAIASQLGLMGFVTCIVCSVLWRATRWQYARPLFIVNALILAASVSRGAAIALVIAMAWPAVRYFGSAARSSARTAVARIGVLAVIVALVGLALVPRFEQRNTGGRSYAGQETQRDESSGREEAWKEYYAIAKRSPVFGHGLGSSPLTKIDQPGFSVQHNEYLRLFLEGGYLGGVIVLLTIVVVVTTAIRRAPRWLRGDLTGAAVALALYSITDNTLTAMPLMVPFCLLLGICASAGHLRPPGSSVRSVAPT